jgi:hypothetical protein
MDGPSESSDQQSSYNDVINFLQEEINDLKRSMEVVVPFRATNDGSSCLEQESQQQQQLLHPLVQQCNDLVREIHSISLADTTDSSNYFLESDVMLREQRREIKSSLQYYQEIQTITQQHTCLEQTELESLQNILLEHQEIHRTLQQLQEQYGEENCAPSDVVEGNSDNDEILKELDKETLELSQENTQLKQDLLCITKYIEQERARAIIDNNTATDSPPPILSQHYASLHACILQFIHQRLHNTPKYIDLSTNDAVLFNPNDITLLREANIIESTTQDTPIHNPNLVSLIDYVGTDDCVES